MSATPDGIVANAYKAGEITHDAMIRLIGYMHLRPYGIRPSRTTDWRYRKQLAELGIEEEDFLVDLPDVLTVSK